MTISNGTPAYKVVKEETTSNLLNKGLHVKMMEIWTIKGDKYYEMELGTLLQKYNEYLPIWQKVIDSFQIVE